MINRSKLLYLVTDQKLCAPRSLEEVVEQAIQGGVNLVQLREKTASTLDIFHLGKRLKKILDFYQVPLIINDRLDLAEALDAAGVHLGQADLPYLEVRKILGPKKIIGLSVNTLEQAKAAEAFDVDYLGVSPIFHTYTKSDLTKPWELAKLGELRKLSSHKLIGIGGINESNVEAILKYGLDGVAVVSAICNAKDPKKSARDLVKKMKRSSR